jgi:hypothetical protein
MLCDGLATRKHKVCVGRMGGRGNFMHMHCAITERCACLAGFVYDFVPVW